MNALLRLIALAPAAALAGAAPKATSPSAPTVTAPQADAWRAEHRLIDLHQHINYTAEHLARAVRIMDRAGLGIGVNLSGGTTTHKPGEKSAFERNKELAEQLFPGRFVHYMNLDYAGWDEPDWSARAAKQVEEGVRLGAAGLKEYKRLGLYLRDGKGKLLKIDDPKLDPVWAKCGERGLPVSIHVADPVAFWKPYDETNERWTELKDHRSWWFGDPNKFPPHGELLAALNRVIGRHPKTTFVGVHFANNAEDLAWVEQSLDTYPNLNADLAARIPEIGRHDPQRVHRLFVKHQDRILFATDFQVYERLTLGSGGSGPPPTDEDAADFYAKHWRWLETWDRNFPHMTPIQGDWTISGIGLPPAVLRKIYFDNARRLLARSLPAPVLKAARVERDFKPDGRFSEAAWERAQPAWLEYQSRDSVPCPALATRVRLLWSNRYLYLGYECPFTELTMFTPARPKQERFGLWEKDVVEAFIGTDPANVKKYFEFEVAPNSEQLDLVLDLPEKDFPWSSGFESAVKVDKKQRQWTAEWRIPFAALGQTPTMGTRWRLNLYRCDYANKAFLAWSPTGQGSFHVPEKFGTLEFGE
jgi:predicted TIM-barrel fold metal-dependent hydrolase